MKTSTVLTVGQVYPRIGLAERFNITDATINTGIFRPAGHDSVWLFVTEKKTPDRTQYKDHLDGDELTWDGQTSGRKDALIVGHQAQGLELLVFYRKSKKEFGNYGFRYEGPFRYDSHSGNKPAHFKLVRVASHAMNTSSIPPEESVGNEFPDELASSEVVEELERRQARGQGFLLDSKLRKALEDHAMDAATRYFRSLGYEVDNHSKSKPYDLFCRRGGEVLHVEVKGTQTDGENIILTPGEVEFARRHKGQMALFILHSVEVTEGENGFVLSEGERHFIMPWDVDQGTLKPVSYTYSVPSRDGCDEGIP